MSNNYNQELVTDCEEQEAELDRQAMYNITHPELNPAWKDDVPQCIWIKLYETGFEKHQSNIGHAVGAGLMLIELDDDGVYYNKEAVTQFLQDYIKFKGVGLY